MASQANVRQTNTIGGQSTLAVNLRRKMEDACEELGISYSLLRTSPADHNRTVLAHAAPARNKSIDIGLRPEQAQESGGYLADLSRARQRRGSRRLADIRMNAAQADAARSTGLYSPFDLWVYSQTGGHRESGEERLTDLDKRQPGGVRLGLTVVPHEKYLRDALAQDPGFPLRLKRKKLLDCSLEPDNRSPIVSRYGRPHQDLLVCKGVASLLAGQLHFPNQRGPSDCTHALGRYGSVVAVSFGLRYWLAAPPIQWWRPLAGAFGFSARSQGNSDDFIVQTIEAATDALTRWEWRSLNEDIDPHKQAFLTLTCPLRLTERGRWTTLITAVEEWLDNHYPFVTPIWSSGPGTPLPELADHSQYWVQASLFYPVSDIPRPVKRLVSSASPRQTAKRQANNGQVKAHEKSPLVRAVR